MQYDIKLGKILCDHCGTSIDVQEADQLSSASGDTGEEHPASYTCTSCGGVIEADPKAVTSLCPYCGSPLVFTDRLEGDMRPTGVLPFTHSRDDAVSAFRKWCHNGRFSPPGFASAHNIQNLKPLYIPYWLYDTDVRAQAHASATRVRVYVRGDMEYTETDFYQLYRSMDIHYHDVPYDASEKFDDTLSSKLLPYDFSQLQAFRLPYLAGFDASQRDYTAQELMPLIEERLDAYSEKELRGTMAGYDTVTITDQHYDYENPVSRYVYLPIWFISYRYRENDYIFAMNGQTGKVIGKPPISKAKIAMWWMMLTGIIFAVLILIGVFI